jgi:hypothetical protein
VSYPLQFANLLDRMSFNWNTQCWNWKLSKVRDGYGRVSYKGKLYLAHRLSLYLYGGITWDELQEPSRVVMHTCDNPMCINPNHLRVGSQLDNIMDRKLKRRSAKHLENRDKSGKFTRKPR